MHNLFCFSINFTLPSWHCCCFSTIHEVVCFHQSFRKRSLVFSIVTRQSKVIGQLLWLNDVTMALDWFSFECRKPRPNQLLTNWTTQPNSYRSKTKVKVIA